MKLLQLNATANWGSTGKIAEGIGVAAMSRGWESYIAYGRYMNPSKSHLISVGSKKDVFLHYARNRFFDEEGLGSKGSTKNLIKQIDEIKPDIIHLHNIHDHWLNYPILFKYFKTIDTPIIWTFHDCWAFTGGCFHFEDKNCINWRDNNCQGKCVLNRKLAAKQYQLRSDLIGSIGDKLTIVCVSDWLANYVRESFLPKTGASICVINNGINIGSFFRSKSSLKEKFILGVSNIWTKEKGIDDFVSLRTILPADIGILLVGLNQTQINRLPKRIEGLKRTNSSTELAYLYNRASVFVNPTYNDSFPTVNLEALACGTPVITYNTGGSPEAVDEKTGLVIEKGNLKELAQAINQVISSPESFTPDDCRQRAELCFNQDIQFGKYVDLYDSVINKV